MPVVAMPPMEYRIPNDLFRYLMETNFKSPNTGGDILLGSEREIFNSRSFPAETYGGNGTLLDDNDKDKQFILLVNSFVSGFQTKKEYFDGIDFFEAKRKFQEVLSMLIDLEPDLISTELSFEKSVFYTFKKGNYMFFLQFFLGEIEPDEDELLLSIYDGDEKLPSFAGNMENTLGAVRELVFPNSIIKFGIPSYELSY
jgi:hypothetical protein